MDKRAAEKILWGAPANRRDVVYKGGPMNVFIDGVRERKGGLRMMDVPGIYLNRGFSP